MTKPNTLKRKCHWRMTNWISYIFATALIPALLAGEPAYGAMISSVRSGPWSDASTWDMGKVPGPADSAVISTGHMVIYDLNSSQLSGMTVQDGATLSFDPNKNVSLDTDKNILIFGNLIIKPASAAVTHLIRFINVDETQFVGGGMKVLDTDVGLWVSGTGVADLNGTAKTSWTNLAGSAQAGAMIIDLKTAPSGWQVGDEVTIAPTGHPSLGSESWAGFDTRKITAINGAQITLDQALTYDHPAVSDPFVTKTYTAEVMNLTRNVRVEGTGNGSPSYDPSQNGRAHMLFLMVQNPQTVRYVQFRHMGPRGPHDRDPTDGVMGRYPVHFHHSGDGARGSLVEGVVVRQSGNRAFVPHASHGITFLDTIAFDSWEDAYWWDPSSRFDQTNNSHDLLFDRAIAAHLKDDPSYRGYTLSGFVLMPGLNNEIRNSVAVGIQGNSNASGFHWPSSANHSPDNVWIFNQNNMAHNNKRDGIFVWQNDHHAHVVDDFVTFRNSDNGIDHGAYRNNYQYKNVRVFENGNNPIVLHAASNDTDVGREDGYSQALENFISDGNLVFANHNLAYNNSALILNSQFMGVIVNEGTNPTQADFVNSGLEPNDFQLVTTLDGMLIRVQRADGTAYQIDHNGNVTTIAPFYDTNLPADPTAPSIPQNLAATAASTSRIDLMWDPSTDNVVVDHYKVYRDSVFLAQTTSTSFSDTGLQASTAYTYEVSAVDAAGNESASSASATATTLAPSPAPTVMISANPTSITDGESSTLSWGSTDADLCTGTNFSTGGLTSGSATVSPSATTTYSISCTGAGGTASDSVTVTVNQPAPAPSISLTANPTSITEGESSTLTWSSMDATSCEASGGWSGTKTLSGMDVVSPTADTSYTLTCTGNGGSQSASVTITVAPADNGGDTTPPVISNIAASDLGGKYDSIRWEITWQTDEPAGTKVVFGRSPDQLIHEVAGQGTTSHSAILDFLERKTTYYYKVMATDSAGNTSESEVMNFTTSGRSSRVASKF